MKIRGSPILVAFLMTFLWPVPAYSQIVLSANELMEYVVENMIKNDMLKTELISFERTKKEYELNQDGSCKATDQDGSCAPPLSEETTLHGKLYPPEVRGGNGGLTIDLGKILTLGHDYILVEDGNYYDRLPDKYKFECDCYIVWFGPKPTLPDIEEIVPPNASYTDKGIHEAAVRMSGLMYVDKKHLFIRRYIGELTQPFNPDVPNAPDSIARITMGSMVLEQEMSIELNDIVVLTDTEIMYQIRQGWFFGYRTRKLVWEWNNYALNELPPDNPQAVQ